MSVLPGPIGITAPTEQIREEGASPEEILKYREEGVHPGIRQREWGLQARLDPSVTFEEYTYWANVERALEEEENRRYVSVTSGQGFLGVIKNYFTTNAYEDAKSREAREAPPITNSPSAYASEKKTSDVVPDHDLSVSPIAPSSHMGDLDAEWRQAARALRNAGWGSVFYLITTDILGWGQTPYVFANTGYGLGIGVFILMGIAAFVSGFMIFRVFIRLDSSRFPIVSFGDPFFRLYGSNMRHFINFMQALQMFLSVAVLQLGQTGIIAQLAGSVNLCYVVCAVISLVVGMTSGYMRSLKHLGWFCNLSVWINIVTFIIMSVYRFYPLLLFHVTIY